MYRKSGNYNITSAAKNSRITKISLTFRLDRSRVKFSATRKRKIDPIQYFGNQSTTEATIMLLNEFWFQRKLNERARFAL